MTLLLDYTVGHYRKEFPTLASWIEYHSERTKNFKAGDRVKLTEEKIEKIRWAMAEGNYNEEFLLRFTDKVATLSGIRHWDDPRLIGYTTVEWDKHSQLLSLADVELVESH